ncbi:helix-turn-helix transcriptional regulator [Bacillus paralicheniformis]|uniref:helix-turn-helix transcriptional regulator n=1 Tax=Bacillus paralicheniformis TaxID=1648923 RepID=UPI002DBED5D7|nr:helix-turn-helix transcriptional regulator [Bacillus paralicheniformis]MEC1870373.1 helix-turn-helix transcriptional regulator [Bacillus paralicheniformis]
MFITFKVGKCRIPELCSNRGIDQTQLAAKVGLTKQQITDYVSLRNKPSIERAYNLAKILGCSIEDLYEWTGVSDTKTEG